MVLGRGATANDCTTPYRRRRPEPTLLYRTVQTHFETWRALSGDGPEGASPPAHGEREFRRYRECGILAHGCDMAAPARSGGSAGTIA